MTKDSVLRRQQMLRDALDHLQLALELVDQASAPGHIGAHIDLAVNQLADALANLPDAAKLNRAEQGVVRH